MTTTKNVSVGERAVRCEQHSLSPVSIQTHATQAIAFGWKPGFTRAHVWAQPAWEPIPQRFDPLTSS